MTNVLRCRTQEPSTPVGSHAPTTATVLKDPLRASAPAAPTSALDKAMSFLNKYKKGTNSAATTTAANTSRKSLDVGNRTFDEDEIDMSFSSDSEAAGRNPTRKAPPRLKADRDEPGLEPRAGTAAASNEKDFTSRSLTLSGMRPFGRFDTAKDLGISGSGGLDGPKAAVSPLGIQNKRPTNSSEGGPSDPQSPGLHLVVNIPGESSTYGNLAKHGSASDIESVGSAVAEALAEQSPGGGEVFEGDPWLGSLDSELAVSSEVEAGGSSSLVSPTLEQQSGSARNLNQDSRGLSSSGLARSPPDRSALGKVLSIDGLAIVPRSQTSPNPREGIKAEDGSGGEHSERSRHSYAAEGAEAGDDDDDDDEEDDYGDDDFEDQDVLMESIGTEGQHTNSASATEAPSQVSRVGQSALPASEGTVNKQEREVLPRPLDAWGMPAADAEEAPSLPGTSDSSTSPRSCRNGDIDWKGGGRAASGTREAWVERPARGSCAKGGESNAPATTGDLAGPPSPNADQCQQQRDNSPRGVGREETRGRSLSKRGVLIDRSTEASNPIRPSDTKVKVIARVEAVASVEYAHDPESGLNLRSCGTQVRKPLGSPFYSTTFQEPA